VSKFEIRNKVPIGDLPAKLKILQEANPETEYVLVRSTGKDDEGCEEWEADEVLEHIEARSPGRYAIFDATDWSSPIVYGSKRDESKDRFNPPARHRASVFEHGNVRLASEVSEGWAQQVAFWRETCRDQTVEIKSLRAERDQLKEDLLIAKCSQEDEIPEEIVTLLSRGMSLIEGRTARKVISARLRKVLPQLVNEIGPEATAKVAAIVAQELNMLGMGDDNDDDEVEEAH
jgi:hypothetical protein